MKDVAPMKAHNAWPTTSYSTKASPVELQTLRRGIPVEEMSKVTGKWGHVGE